MRFVKSVVLAAMAVSVVACGGAADMEESSTPEQIETPAGEQPVSDTGDQGEVRAMATCTGYDGNNYCLAECNDGVNAWYTVGHVSAIPWGDCASAAFNFCRSYGYSGHNGACWGY